MNRRRQPFQGCALPPELPGHSLGSLACRVSVLSRRNQEELQTEDSQGGWKLSEQPDYNNHAQFTQCDQCGSKTVRSQPHLRSLLQFIEAPGMQRQPRSIRCRHNGWTQTNKEFRGSLQLQTAPGPHPSLVRWTPCDPAAAKPMRHLSWRPRLLRLATFPCACRPAKARRACSA